MASEFRLVVKTSNPKRSEDATKLSQILMYFYSKRKQTYIFLTATLDISRCIDNAYILRSQNKVPTGSDLSFHCCNECKFCLPLIVELIMKENEYDDLKLFYMNIFYRLYQ